MGVEFCHMLLTHLGDLMNFLPWGLNFVNYIDFSHVKLTLHCWDKYIWSLYIRNTLLGLVIFNLGFFINDHKLDDLVFVFFLPYSFLILVTN